MYAYLCLAAICGPRLLPLTNRLKHRVALRDPDRPQVLIEGVLFRARYLGSTQLVSEGQPSKAMRMMQAQEAVGRIKVSGTKMAVYLMFKTQKTL
ncbi:hypothetical protein V1264_002454 [Littorina saxatilis]|uniref:PID domain-containing protein n=1 Tax=Littorina saxatilis TaxID=31220 RepID=A0AAN9C3G1_9CAEN